MTAVNNETPKFTVGNALTIRAKPNRIRLIIYAACEMIKLHTLYRSLGANVLNEKFQNKFPRTEFRVRTTLPFGNRNLYLQESRHLISPHARPDEISMFTIKNVCIMHIAYIYILYSVAQPKKGQEDQPLPLTMQFNLNILFLCVL